MNTTRCTDCVDQLTAFQLGLVPEADDAIVTEHLAGCPDCRVFADQLDQTTVLLADLPLASPVDLADGVRRSVPAASQTPAELLDALCRLADGIDPDNAQDLVQDVFVSIADTGSDDVSFKALARQLTDAALADDESGYRLVDAFDAQGSVSEPDPDGDTAELYYPEFYSDGPDLGRFKDAPTIWGETITPSPDADAETGELLGVVDAALGDLPAPLAQLVQLVDLERVELSDAAAVLRLTPDDAAAGLHRGRVHVRGAVERYLQ